MENNTAINMAKQEDKEVSLKDVIFKLKEWWDFLFTKWKIIVAAGVIGALIGIGYAYLKDPLYKAELSFALDDSRGSSLGAAAGLASQLGFDMGGGNDGIFSGDNLVELMKSRSMVEKTLLTTVNIKGKNETLAELYISYNKLRLKWDNIPALKNIHYLPNADRTKFSLQQDSILGVFYNGITKANLTVDKVDKKLSIITVTVNSENELFSKYFAEVLAKTVSDFYVETRTKKSVQNVQILEHQTDSVRRQLNAAINGTAASIDAVPNANPNQTILRTPSQRHQFDVQTNQAILVQLVQNLEISKVALRKETPLIQIIDSPILPLEKTKVSRLKGLILGGMIAGLVTALFLLLKKLLHDILNS